MTPEQLHQLPSYCQTTFGLPTRPPQPTILALIQSEKK